MANVDLLKGDILKDIQDSILDIYIKYQTRLYITSGDIEPLMAIMEDETEEKLAEIITSVILNQLKTEVKEDD